MGQRGGKGDSVSFGIKRVPSGHLTGLMKLIGELCQPQRVQIEVPRLIRSILDDLHRGHIVTHIWSLFCKFFCIFG